MYRHEVGDLKGRFTNFAAIGFAAAAVESVLDEENSFGDLQVSIELMLDEVWRLPDRPPPRGLPLVTERQRNALPSARLYRHTSRLYEHCSELGSCPHERRGRAYHLAGGAVANLLFVVWRLDGTEAVLNPDKPLVVPGDIAETDWTALVDGLEQLAGSARDPNSAYEWQRRTIRRLADEHPASPNDFIGTPLSKAYFGVTRAERDPSELDPLPSLASVSEHRLRVEAVEDTLTDHATIALATATLERLIPEASVLSELGTFISNLVDDLWSWQADASLEAMANLPREHAEAFPSFRFYGRVGKVGDLGAVGTPRLPALVGAVRSAIGICAWLMDGLERRATPGLPFILDDEVDERGWDQLVDALSYAVQASADPDTMLSWERVAIRRLRWHHPACLGEQASEPVSKELFRRATEWPFRRVDCER